MTQRDPLAIARGLGTAKDGVNHWWLQRLTAIALMLLTPWFMYLMFDVIGAEQFDIRATIAQPLNAALLVAFLLALFWHARLGLQVVIEDYVHGWLEMTLQIVVKLVYSFAAIASVLAVGRIVFSA